MLCKTSLVSILRLAYDRLFLLGPYFYQYVRRKIMLSNKQYQKCQCGLRRMQNICKIRYQNKHHIHVGQSIEYYFMSVHEKCNCHITMYEYLCFFDKIYEANEISKLMIIYTTSK